MKKKLKGFTLVEMIIVLAIIGILGSILCLSWMNYIARSRMRTQNQNARVVFNAAQTIVQEYHFKERKASPADIELGSGDFYFYWNGSSGQVVDASGNDLGASVSFCEDFANKVNKIFTGENETVYKIYVYGYMVQSVVSGRYNEDRYLGSYPVKQEDSSTGNEVQSFLMTDVVLP